MHIVLLGDSIFDNGVYVEENEPDVRQQLQHLAKSAQVTLLAIDGSTTHSLEHQVRKIPPDATHLVVSVGGNDLLGYYHILTQITSTMFDALIQMAMLRKNFATNYESALRHLMNRNLPLTLCTIYYPSYEEEALQEAAKIAVALFNDVILMAAHQYKLPIIDLRLICTEPADYANPIEPSAQGGAKIAGAIAEHLFSKKENF